jgi:hypothetical protein
MAQHDYVIANGTGAAVRSDLNNALAAIVSQNSGATEPATTYAYQWWADTTTNLLKLRNSANSGWITLFQLDGEYSTIALENGTAAAPSIYFKDSGTDTGFYSPGANQVGISTGGTARLTIDSNGNVDIDSNTLYVDATNNRVGLGTSSPSQLLTAVGNIKIAGAQASNTAKLCLTRTDTSWSINNETDLRFYYGTGDTDSPATAGVAFTSIGRVGIGTTSPSAPLHVNGTANSTAITFSVAGTVTGYIGPAGFIGGSDVNMGYRVESGNNHVFHIGATERARIDSSGRLLVGTSTSRAVEDLLGNGPQGLIQIEAANSDAIMSIISAGTSDAGRAGTLSLGRHRNSTVGATPTIVQSGDTLGAICFAGGDGTDMRTKGASIACQVDGTPGVDDMPGRLVFSTTADGASSPTERMRISEAGHILGGGMTSLTAGSSVKGFNFENQGNNGRLNLHANSSAGTASGINFYHSGSQVGGITYSSTATAYNTSSDYRLKENVVPLTGAADRLNQLQVHRFNFIADPDKIVDGFLAHEAQAVVPECVTGTKDEVDADGNPVYQGIDQSKLVPLLTAALQEAIAKIETLEAKVAALEAA